MKIIKKMISILLVATFLLIISGCGEKIEEKNIVYDSLYSVSTLDPQLAYEFLERELSFNIFSGLTSYLKDGSLSLACAKDYKISKDKLKYTFILKDDILWSNGEKVTAYDFEYGIKKAFTKNFNAPYSYTLEPIKNAKAVLSGKKSTSSLGVKAVNESTIIFTLEYKYQDFLKLLSTPICSPCNKKFFVSCKGYYGLDKKHIITNGNYKVTEWNDEYLSLVPTNEKNSKVFIYFNDYDKIIENLKEKDADYTVLSSSQLYDTEKQGITLSTQLIEDKVYALLVNKNSEYINSDIIKAFMSTATCKPDEIMIKYGVNKAKSILPPIISNVKNTKYKDTSVKYKKKAQKYFLNGCESLGVSHTYKTVTLTYIDDAISNQLSKDIAQSWQASLGITANISSVSDMNSLVSLINDKTYDFCLVPLYASNTSPFNYLRQFLSSSNSNYLGFKNKNFDKAIKAYTKNPTSKHLENALNFLECYTNKKVMFTSSTVCATPNNTAFAINPIFKVTDYTEFG